MHTDALHAPPLMAQLMIEGLNRHDDRPCLLLGDAVLSYAQVRDAASRMVQVLQSQGLGVGSRVAVLSGNRPELLANLAAMQITGCCGTTLHPLGSLDDHAHVLQDAAIGTLIYDAPAFEQRAAELRERVPGLARLLALGPTAVGEDYLELARRHTPQPLVAPAVAPDDVTSIVYTGGTTGKPKGVMLTARGTAYLCMLQMAEWEFPQDLRMLICTPLSHAAAAFFVPVLQRGGAFYVSRGFAPDEFFDMVERHRITATMLVPVMIYRLLDAPRAATADLSSLQTVFYGASAISPQRLQEALQRWGPIFTQFFGQSEAPMALAQLRRREHELSQPQRLASCGRPTPWMHLALLDEQHRPVAAGEPGEICVRGPLVMQGYLGLPEQTAEAFAGGWLHTGDIGRIDDDGYLYIVDRKKDMIVSGGFNVFPREVEDVLSAHPAVAQVAVIGVPDARWGEAVKALIVLRPATPGDAALADELVELVRQAKGPVQAPKSVDFVASIPLTPVGKPDKKALRELHWAGANRRV